MKVSIRSLASKIKIYSVSVAWLFVGAATLPAAAATWYFAFEIHDNNNGSGTQGQSLFQGVAVITTATSTPLTGEYYFNTILPVSATVPNAGVSSTVYTPSNIGIGTTSGGSGSPGGSTPIYNVYNNALPPPNGVPNGLGSIQCGTQGQSPGQCYLKDAAFGYTITVSGSPQYYWIEGQNTSSTSASLDLHNATFNTSGDVGYLPTSRTALIPQTKNDCGPGQGATSCFLSETNPLPEIDGGSLPKAIVLLASMYFILKKDLHRRHLPGSTGNSRAGLDEHV